MRNPFKGMSPLQLIGLVITYSFFMALIGYFSNSPTYQHLAPDMATIKLSLRHSGQLLGECTDRTPEQMANLPPNMRTLKICPRERSPLLLELLQDGELVFSQQLDPRGLHGDGMAAAYFRLTVPVGEINLQVRLKDKISAKEFPYQASYNGVLSPAEILVVDFDSQKKEFMFY